MKLIWSATFSYWISPVVVIIGLCINYLVGPQPWQGEALLGVEWVWTAQFLVGPVVAAVAAVDGARTLSRDPQALLGTRKLRNSFVVRWLLMTTLTISVPYVVCTLVAAYLAPSVPDYALVSMLLTPVFGIASIAIILMIGAFMGSALGDKLGALVALGIVLVLGVLALSGNTPSLMNGGPSGSLIGLQRGTDSLILQSVTILVVLAAMWLALVVLPRHGRWQLATVTIVCAGLILLIVPRLSVDGYAFANPTEENLSCSLHEKNEGTVGELESCVVGEHVRLGADIDLAFQEIHVAAKNAGISNLPLQLKEVYPHTGLVSENVATFAFTGGHLDTSDKKTPVSTQWLVAEITEPRFCPGLFADYPPNDEYWNVVETAQTSLMTIVESNGLHVESSVKKFNGAWKSIRACQGAS